MAKTGRPRIQIDQKVFENLCKIQCTLEEISSVFSCSMDTIERWCKRTYHATFADTNKSLSAYGKSSLRRYQFEMAKKNASMAIWLGKQYLGQRDNFEFEDREAISKLDQVLDEVRGKAIDSEDE